MKVEIVNEYEFNLENITEENFYIGLLQKNDTYKHFIDKLEDYERTYTDFNLIDVSNFFYNSHKNYFEIIIKINDLLAYDKNPFYYKKIIVRK